MSSMILTFRSVTLEQMNVVLTECAKHREMMLTNLANGPEFAPQVHCGGTAHGRMLYTIITPPMLLDAAAAITRAAHDAYVPAEVA